MINTPLDSITKVLFNVTVSTDQTTPSVWVMAGDEEMDVGLAIAPTDVMWSVQRIANSWTGGQDITIRRKATALRIYEYTFNYLNWMSWYLTERGYVDYREVDFDNLYRLDKLANDIYDNYGLESSLSSMAQDHTALGIQAYRMFQVIGGQPETELQKFNFTAKFEGIERNLPKNSEAYGDVDKDNIDSSNLDLPFLKAGG